MTQTTEQQAQALYDQAQAQAAQYHKMGITLPAGRIQNATLEEISAHVTLCRTLSDQYRVSLDPVAMWGQDVPARALGKARANAGRRGVKALKNKYGESLAADIVYRHSGRSIQ